MRVCIVGSSTHFLSGISYFTLRLASALADRVPVSAILMRQLIPAALYPGRDRVGAQLAEVRYPPHVPVFDGVDWYWVPSMWNAARFLTRERPTHVVFQWWTGAVLHSFLALALLQRTLGGKVVIEFHEVQDPDEAKFPLARWYVSVFAGLLMRLANGFVLHSDFDEPFLQERFAIGTRPVAVIPHGPYDHHATDDVEPLREAPAEACNLLFFGTIRHYKGLEDLVEAFELASDAEPGRYWLTVVGETWEGWTQPIEMIRASRHARRITLVNRYVTDSEVNRWFAGADAVVLPYRRSSASGPLHLSMSIGHPTVVTSVGGLPEAAKDYEGIVFVPPADVNALVDALEQVGDLRGRRYADPHSWDRSAEGLLQLLQSSGL
ncbi:MAG TPA: glycosyltransferase [Solirubrobacteraceae bacterium]|nr:glycosyltransferase [Solirubrobacteraceae bacterium]